MDAFHTANHIVVGDEWWEREKISYGPYHVWRNIIFIHQFIVIINIDNNHNNKHNIII